jgi:two-component system sensor histidine kinase MtrB
VARRWPLLRPALAVAAAAAVAAGCAGVPTVGQPQEVRGASGQAEQQFVQPIPPVPGRGWTAREVVQGFLAASASFAGAPAAARFLAPSLRRTFKPANTVTVLSGPLHLLARRTGSRTIEGESTVIQTISLTGQQLANISDVGQYVDNPAPRTYVFQLARYNRQWLIITLPNESGVLLTQPNFVQVYQPRNLYVFSPLAGGQGLVPEPLFAPQGDTYSDLAKDLVNGLLNTSQQKAWLSPATNTAFTPGMHLRRVTIVGSDAVVDLGGAVDGLGAEELSQIATQLVATLTSTSYGQAPISKSVTLELNGHIPPGISQESLDPHAVQAKVPGTRASTAPLYYLNAAGAVSELQSGKARTVRGPAGRGQIPLQMIAVSPTRPTQLAGTLASGRDCVIYYGSLSGSGELSHATIGDHRCDSLSWDTLGDIWAVSGNDVFVLRPGSRQPVQVGLPPQPGNSPSPYRVLSLRVAPDGVRVAMLVQQPDGVRRLLLTAVTRVHSQIAMVQADSIIGTSLTADSAAQPSSLSWYDPDHLIVLAGTQLYEVPVNGGDAIAGGPVPRGTESITAAGPGRIAAVSQGEILTSSGPEQIQQPAVKGTSPAYPG